MYDGTSLAQVSDGTNTLRFVYNGSGKPMRLTYNNSVVFAYLYNAQGDVVGLANASGQQVVAYTYDAWGNILTQTDTSGRNLAKLNPFRYRGYVYDEETGLYYLQSRFYQVYYGHCRLNLRYKGRINHERF